MSNLSERQKWSLRWYTAYNAYFFNAKLRDRIPLTFLELLHYQNLLTASSPLLHPLTLFLPREEWGSTFLVGRTVPLSSHDIPLSLPEGTPVVELSTCCSFPLPGPRSYMIGPGRWRIGEGKVVYTGSKSPSPVAYFPLGREELEEVRGNARYDLTDLMRRYRIEKIAGQSREEAILFHFREWSPPGMVVDPDVGTVRGKKSPSQWRKKGVLFFPKPPRRSPRSRQSQRSRRSQQSRQSK